MIGRLAIRDIRKSWKRSLTVISTVTLSVALLEIGVGYMDGFREKIYNQAVRESGHVRITAPGYRDKLDLQPLKPNIAFTDGLRDSLRALPHVKRIHPIIRYGALANSPERTLEMQVIGAPPEIHAATYIRLQSTVTSGRFLDGPDQVMLGSEAARLLNVSAGDKLILLTSDAYGGMSAVEPEIAGVFKSYNATEDAMLVLADLRASQKLLGLDNRVTELTLELRGNGDVETAATAARERFGKRFDISTWKENEAGLLMLIEYSDVGMAVIATIILIVASLGMINTFLLSVLERLPDFGTLRAIGMLPRQLVQVVVLQGAILGLIGTVTGLAAGIPVVLHFQAHPIDYGKAVEAFRGVDSVIGMALYPQSTAWIFALGIAIAVGACLYPAVYAGRRRPVEILQNLG